MKNIILICTIIVLFITSSCENKVNEDTLSQFDDIQQKEETEEIQETQEIQDTVQIE